MRILTGLLRILIGFAVACLVAGAVTAAFVITPSDVAALPDDLRPERLNNAGVLSLLAATHSAIFSFPFALLVIGFGEWRSIRSWLYYVIAGILIALGGFGAEYMIEAGDAALDRQRLRGARLPHDRLRRGSRLLAGCWTPCRRTQRGRRCHHHGGSCPGRSRRRG